jgi:hypothetical protein
MTSREKYLERQRRYNASEKGRERYRRHDDKRRSNPEYRAKKTIYMMWYRARRRRERYDALGLIA